MTGKSGGCPCTTDAIRLLDDLERRFRSTLRQQALELAQRRSSASPVVTPDDVRMAVRVVSGRSLAEVVSGLAESVPEKEPQSDAA